MIQYYFKLSAETSTTGFWPLIFNILCEDVHSQLWACQAVGANHHQCCGIFMIQGNVTGVICRVVTPKDKERYPSSYKTKCTKTGIMCRVVTPKDKERNQNPLTKRYEEKNLNLIRRR